MPPDGADHERVTDDSASGPSQLAIHVPPPEYAHSDVAGLHEVIEWLRRAPPRIGVFVLYDKGGVEEAMGVVEKFPNNIMVRGFLFSPYLSADVGETRNFIQCELLRIAREAKMDIVFRF